MSDRLMTMSEYERSIRRHQMAWRIGTFLWTWVVTPLLILVALLGIWNHLLDEPRLYQDESLSLHDGASRVYSDPPTGAVGIVNERGELII